MPVFNLLVPHVGCFYTKRGFIVSNCDATRYAYVDIEDAQIVNGGMHHRHPLQTWAPLDDFTGF